MRLAMALLAAGASFAAEFSGTSALEFAGRAVAFGPRPAGSRANRQLQDYIRSQIQARGGQLTEDAWTAATPVGKVPMRNLVCRLPGTGSGRAVVFTGHFDTKLFPGRRFVGANDGGSSTGFLLEMMRALQGSQHRDDVYLVWFDGEEAFGEWSETDGVYGSRHLADRWAREGFLARIRALVNVDMIGDKDLGIAMEMNSTASLRTLVWQAAADKGYGRYFLDVPQYIEDDHAPFLRRGVPALDLIDFNYGPDNSWWHTDRDTLDKLSPHSFQVVGDVLLELLRRFNER